MQKCFASLQMLCRGFAYVVLGSLLWLLTGCMASPLLELAPPQSPPDEMLAGPLIGHSWRVEEVTYQGTAVRHDWNDPVFFTFTATGTLQVDLGSSCYDRYGTIVYYGQQRFQVEQMAVPASICQREVVEAGEADCEALVGINATKEECVAFLLKEDARFSLATHNVNHYSVEGDQLLLSGPEAEIRLVLEIQ